MKTWIKRLLGLLLWLSLGIVLSLALASVLALRALKPAPGEWAHTVRLGPLTHDVSVPAALRIATHPFMLRLLEGRSLRTPYGRVQWQAMAAPNTWRAVCAPCTFRVDALSHTPIRLSRVELTVVPDMEMALQGSFSLGETPQALQGRWSSRIERSQLVIQLHVQDEPAARVFELFRPDIPELARAQIEGRVSAHAQWRLPSHEFTLKPHVAGLRVSGLGTEPLMHAQPSCGEAHDFGPWLPRAVVAAMDPQYHEHPGFDLAAIIEARPGTLSQELAKLLYVGDDRSHGRKLRELLYAVELDRTLGKARLLHLYLAIAPWGHGQCGATAAARHYFSKPARDLTPQEAAWLASRLRS